jgi:hypothetical protein
MRVSQFFIPSVVLVVASFALVRCSFGPSAYSGELPGPPPPPPVEAAAGDDGGGGDGGGGDATTGNDDAAGGDATTGNDAAVESGGEATIPNDAADGTTIDARSAVADGGTKG